MSEQPAPTTPTYVPLEWPPAVDAASARSVGPVSALCACPTPLPEVRAEWKGAARTHCARCGLPVRIAFDRR